ncbi:hypothetical protein ABOM_012162 [Aspergillus bombycis]|uniref:Uncharacterized protein n=1 Tax=Aspergillus bombycis TaxID=109264 RepID=A0A1F7ZIB4_9EURO|nr:hypothetical protein ABOM_012162 [Aspergillus bombycis]OGM39197.1 hypothetical protein ABOM_012162 [Aspergillus bombycis]
MSDDNVDQETFPLRFRDPVRDQNLGSPEVGVETGFSKKPVVPVVSDAGSPAGSSSTNQARHSTSSSLLKRLESSGDVPNGYIADGLSDPDSEWVSPNKRRCQSRHSRRGPSSASPGRPIRRPITENLLSKAQFNGTDAHFRSASTKSPADLSGDFSQTHHQRDSNQILNESPHISNANLTQGAMASVPVSNESRESLSHEQKMVGGHSAVAGGIESTGIILQPETHPITEDQLANEVRGIYAGLVMVEKKCIDIVKQQFVQESELSHQQWQALIALHRTLLQEHHDFFMASQHPSANLALRKSSEKYNVPARMWRYGIQTFLELLHRRLPDSLEHMLTFIYLAYSMLTLLLETVPAFEETWIECLGDLSRYGVVIEERGLLDHEIWVGIARYWYNKAVDKNPDVGRIQHHLGVLARPDIVQQLFYYTKSLVCVRPFPRTRVSILRFFSPLLQGPRVIGYPHVTTAFVSAHGYLFTQATAVHFIKSSDEFLSSLEKYIPRVGVTFRMQGVYLTSSNFAAMLEYSNSDSLLCAEFHQVATEQAKPSEDLSAAEDPVRSAHEAVTSFLTLKAQQDPSQLAYGSSLAFETFSVMLEHVNNMNLFPALHTSLAFLWCLSYTATGMKCVEAVVPWNRIVIFLNMIIQPSFLQRLVQGWLSSLDEFDFNLIEGAEFPISNETSWLPEDFLIRGQIWSQVYYPSSFFESCPSDEDGRNVERESLSISRMYRCLWLGVRLAKFNRWIMYDPASRQFTVTPFALELEAALKSETISELEKMVETKSGSALYLAEFYHAIKTELKQLTIICAYALASG